MSKKPKLKNLHHSEFTGLVDQTVSDERLYASQLNSQSLFDGVSALISGLEGMFQCFGVQISGVMAYDDRRKSIENFVVVHGAVAETGLMDRLEAESRFLLRDLLFPTIGEMNFSNDFGLVALCHHFHSQPLFKEMVTKKEMYELNYFLQGTFRNACTEVT